MILSVGLYWFFNRANKLLKISIDVDPRFVFPKLRSNLAGRPLCGAGKPCVPSTYTLPVSGSIDGAEVE